MARLTNYITYDVFGTNGQKVAETIFAQIYSFENQNKVIAASSSFQVDNYQTLFPQEDRGSQLYIYSDKVIELSPFVGDGNFISYSNSGKNSLILNANGNVSYFLNSNWVNSNTISLADIEAKGKQNIIGGIAYANFFVKSQTDTNTKVQEINYTFSSYSKSVEVRKVEDYVTSLKEIDQKLDVPNYWLNGIGGLNKIVHLKAKIPGDLDKRIFISFLHYSSDAWDNNYNLAIKPEKGKFEFSNVGTDTPIVSVNFSQPINTQIIYDMYFGVTEMYDVVSNQKVAEKLTAVLSYTKLDGTVVNMATIEHLITDYEGKTYSNNVFFYAEKMQLYGAEVEREYDINLVLGEEIFDSVTVEYSKDYNFADKVPTALGYEFKNWYYLDQNESQIIVDASGYWYENFTTKVNDRYVGTLYAEMEEIEYNIIYNTNDKGEHNNPQTYDISQIINLQPLQNLPAGEIFMGWYNTVDNLKVTQIRNQTGDISLYAKIEQGYNVTVKLFNQTDIYQVLLGESFVLPEPAQIEGMTFNGWSVFDTDSNNYVPFSGTSVAVDKEYIFKANYNYSSYTIEYELNGGTNSTENKETFTLQDGLVVLHSAKKEGHLFEGWFLEADFLNKITQVDSLDNIKVYAKYYKVELPTEYFLFAKESAQFLPMPTLPMQTEVNVELYLQNDRETKLELDNFMYVFDKVNSYIAIYKIGSGSDIVNKEIVINVINSPIIKLDGAYKQSYLVGDSLRVLNATLTALDEQMLFKVEKDGKLIDTNNQTILLEEGNYKITYFTTLSDIAPLVVNIEVNAQKPPVKKSNLGAIVASSVVAAVLLAGTGLFVFIKRKK